MRYQLILISLVILFTAEAQEKKNDLYISFKNCITGDKVDYDQPVYLYALPEDTLSYTISTTTLNEQGFIKIRNFIRGKYRVAYKGYDGAMTSREYDLFHMPMLSLCYNDTQFPVDSALALLQTGDSLTISRINYTCYLTSSQRISFVKNEQGYTVTIYQRSRNKFEKLMKNQLPVTTEVICLRGNEESELKRFMNEIAHVSDARARFTSVYVITVNKLKWSFTLHNDQWDGYDKMWQALKERSAQLVLHH